MRHRHYILSSLPLLLCLSALAACRSTAPPPSTFSTRDSVGITIAENSGVAPEDGGGWAISSEPTLRIGALDGDEGYLFSRISGATRLPDGRIAVGDNRSPDLRVFSAEGEHLHTFGGRGEGPGEFRSPRLMGALPGDTLVVADSRLRRINLFHLDHGFIRSATASTEIPGILLTEGMFSSGSIFIFRMVFAENQANGFSRRPLHYRSVALDGTLEADFGEFVGEELVLASETEGQAAMSIMGNSPFGKSASVAVGGGRFFYGSQDSYEVQVWTQEGELERIIRVDKPLETVTQDQVTAFIEEELEDLEDNSLAREYRRQVEEAPIPDFHPAYGAFFVDTEGHLWIEETRISDEELRLFSVFNPEGRWVGSLSLPDRFRVQEIGRDYLLGSTSDDLGVQYLEMYDLIRPG